MAMLPQHFYISTSRAPQKAACQLQLHIMPRLNQVGFPLLRVALPPRGPVLGVLVYLEIDNYHTQANLVGQLLNIHFPH